MSSFYVDVISSIRTARRLTSERTLAPDSYARNFPRPTVLTRPPLYVYIFATLFPCHRCSFRDNVIKISTCANVPSGITDAQVNKSKVCTRTSLLCNSNWMLLLGRITVRFLSFSRPSPRTLTPACPVLYARSCLVPQIR